MSVSEQIFLPLRGDVAMRQRGSINCRKAVEKKRGYDMERKQSELTVITKAKDLCSYIMTVTQKSPKHFRYTFVSKIQNLALSVIENIYRANDVFVSKQDLRSQKERLKYQRAAMTDLKLLGYISLISMEQKCILPKQYEQIARQVSDCQNLLGAWMNSDRKRLQS